MDFAENGSLLVCSAALLALTAVVGFRLGRRRKRPVKKARSHERPEIERGLSVVSELESVAGRLRTALASHAPAVRKFNNKLARYERRSDLSWHELCDRADEMLKPALRLTAEISHTYAELQQQMS